MKAIDKKVIDEKTKEELLRQGFRYLGGSYDFMFKEIRKGFLWWKKREKVVIYEFNSQTGRYQLS